MNKSTIVSAEIKDMPKGPFDPMPKVIVTLQDGSDHELFSYYPDEISFTASEFTGLTLEKAMTLRHCKDVAYLKS
jgi:hypothetical protein